MTERVFAYFVDAIKAAHGNREKLEELRLMVDSIARNEALPPELWNIENYLAFVFRHDEDVLEAFDLYYNGGVEETAQHFGWKDTESRMKEYALTELGFFSKQDCEAIKAALDGKTYMSFHVGYSNCAGNCTLIISTDYQATEQEIKSFFLNCALSTLCNLTRR